MTANLASGAEWRLACALLALLAPTACSAVQKEPRPSWLDGAGDGFPAQRYLVGLGQGDSRSLATERAYEAVARIFRAEVTAQAKDWESYVLLEGRGKGSHERRLTVERLTRVSTEKVLENVQVLDGWVDPDTGVHSVLAGMNRVQAETALLERIREMDEAIQEALEAARGNPDTLAAIRDLKRAADRLVLREAYNADLRVVRPSGRGHPAKHRVASLTGELERYLASHLRIGVEVSGEQAETVRRAVMEGLIRQGLPVTERDVSTEPTRSEANGRPPLTLLVKGTARLWNAAVSDPMFSYVRWCADFVVLDPGTDLVVGAVSRRGREGHVTEQEAETRALHVMQRELSADLSSALAGYVYGRSGSPRERTAPAACPHDGTGMIRPRPPSTPVRSIL